MRSAVLLATAALLVSSALAVGAGARTAHTSGAGVQPAACHLLNFSGVRSGVARGHPVRYLELLNSCSAQSCWAHFTSSNGSKKCAYGHGAIVTLAREPTARQARERVRSELQKGYRQVTVGADLAGIVADSKGAGVVMAVGRTFAVFTLGAASDNNSNSTWAGAKVLIKKGARRIARALRQPGCPPDCPQ